MKKELCKAPFFMGRFFIFERYYFRMATRASVFTFKAQFLAKVLCGSFLFAATTCFYHSISFTAYHKVYRFPFSENELRQRLANGYGTYNRSQRNQKAKRALIVSEKPSTRRKCWKR